MKRHQSFQFFVVVWASMNCRIDGAISAQQLFQRLVGAPLAPHSSQLTRMQALIDSGNLVGAAEIALSDHRFLAIRIRNLVAPMSSRTEDVAEPFNDMQALMIGIVRDNLDSRQFLTATYRYQGYRDLGLSPVSTANNTHFQEFESRGLDFWTHLTRAKEQWPAYQGSAGVLTTRAWAEAHLTDVAGKDGGTNRRAFEYAMREFLCVTKEQWLDAGIPDGFVRRDVDRNIGGNPLTYQSHCRNCHSIMDAAGGAFAQLDFVKGNLTFLDKAVASKMNQNSGVWPDGYVTTDSSWTNWAVYHHNSVLGWRGKTHGDGVSEFAGMLANSRAFSRCMARRVFEESCHRSIQSEEMAALEPAVDRFETQGYSLRKLFVDIATMPTCIGGSQAEDAHEKVDRVVSMGRRRTSPSGCPHLSSKF